MKKSYGTFSTDVGTDQQLFFYSFAKNKISDSKIIKLSIIILCKQSYFSLCSLRVTAEAAFLRRLSSMAA